MSAADPTRGRPRHRGTSRLEARAGFLDAPIQGFIPWVVPQRPGTSDTIKRMAIGFIERQAERHPAERIVCRVRKDPPTGEARVRDIPGHGRELPFTVGEELVASFMARDHRGLEAMALEKLAGFRVRDWQPVAVYCCD
jgi:hypothetical protein